MTQYGACRFLRPLIIPVVFMVLGLAVPVTYSQRDQDLPGSQASEYGAKFFDQLQTIFGRFRDADLKRVFQTARPIQCSDLVTDRGEWREVAFFNENRTLGDWYRTSLDEVRSDLAVFIFKGACGGRRAAVQVTTKFPVDESVTLYRERRISFREIEVNVNAPVTATYDDQTQAYIFNLPYLFRVAGKDGTPVYTLSPRRVSDRYAADVTNHWECKSVSAEDVTYQFLICHTTLIPRNAASGSSSSVPFGASAYSILSDGREAASSVTLQFGAPEVPAAESKNERPSEPRPTDQPLVETKAWRAVQPQERLAEIGQSEFRLRFNVESWKGRIGQPQLIADGTLSSFGTVSTPRSKDYCIWRPGASTQANQLLDSSKMDSVLQSLGYKKEAQSGTSAIFELQSDTGMALGTLQCFFLKGQTPADITAGMWQSIVGASVVLEVPRL
jgi:hypothetical protein